MKAPRLVRRYAATLLEAAVESRVLEAVRGDVEGLAATLEHSEPLASFVGDRLIEPERKRGALDRLFGGRVQPLTLNFLRLLVERRRAALLPEILAEFAALLDQREGRTTAEVRSATALSAAQVEALRARLAAYTGKEVRLELEVDEGLGGGLVVQVGDTVFDGSLAMHLDNLRRQLAGTRSIRHS